MWSCQAVVAHNCNPSYLGGRDQEDHIWKPAQANSSRDLILEILNTKSIGRKAQVVERLPNKQTKKKPQGTKRNKKCWI
jgi:hypothetical protein